MYLVLLTCPLTYFDVALLGFKCYDVSAAVICVLVRPAVLLAMNRARNEAVPVSLVGADFLAGLVLLIDLIFIFEFRVYNLLHSPKQNVINLMRTLEDLNTFVIHNVLFNKNTSQCINVYLKVKMENNERQKIFILLFKSSKILASFLKSNFITFCSFMKLLQFKILTEMFNDMPLTHISRSLITRASFTSSVRTAVLLSKMPAPLYRQLDCVS